MIASKPQAGIRLCGSETDEVQAFIREHDLARHVDAARSLVFELFPLIDDIEMERRADPEFDDEWLTLKILTVGDVDSVLDAYDKVTRRLATDLPTEIGSKIRISLGIPHV